MLADGWYSSLIPGFQPVTGIIDGLPRSLRALVLRIGPFRALITLIAGSSYDLIAVTRTDPGWRSLLVLRALLGRRRKLVVLHFIDHPLAGWWGQLWRVVDRWAVRRAVLRAQVLSRWEVELYATRFAMPAEAFHFVPFAWRSAGGAVSPAAQRETSLVVSAGRAFCDWPTLFEAARGASWPLVVICSGHDLAQVERLNANGRATVLTDVEHESAREWIRQAAVCVLSMREVGVSHGHVRLLDAVDAGAAIVASRIRSLEGYVEDGQTAVLVPPGDADGMRSAIESLLADPARREEMARAAFDRAAAWTWEDYLIGIDRFVRAGG